MAGTAGWCGEKWAPVKGRRENWKPGPGPGKGPDGEEEVKLYRRGRLWYWPFQNLSF